MRCKLSMSGKALRCLIFSEEDGELLVLTLAASVGGSATRLSWMIGEDLNQQSVLSLLELIDDSVVQRVLVLLQPSCDVVRHLDMNNDTTIMSAHQSQVHTSYKQCTHILHLLNCEVLLWNENGLILLIFNCANIFLFSETVFRWISGEFLLTLNC